MRVKTKCVGDSRQEKTKAESWGISAQNNGSCVVCFHPSLVHSLKAQLHQHTFRANRVNRRSQSFSNQTIFSMEENQVLSLSTFSLVSVCSYLQSSSECSLPSQICSISGALLVELIVKVIKCWVFYPGARERAAVATVSRAQNEILLSHLHFQNISRQSARVIKSVMILQSIYRQMTSSFKNNVLKWKSVNRLKHFIHSSLSHTLTAPVGFSPVCFANLVSQSGQCQGRSNNSQYKSLIDSQCQNLLE